MQEKKNRDMFFVSLGINPDALVWAEQIHGNMIHQVTAGEAGETIADVDGLVYKREPNALLQPMLAVHVGDCVPMLFADPVAEVIGVLHAGWKGTKDHSARAMLQSFVRLGAKPEHILVAVGPYNHACCYDVTEERAMLFEREFPGGRGIVNKSKDSWYIDIGAANIADLRGMGIEKAHIDWNERLCTHCNEQEFYSFRRKTEPFGEIMGYIGYHEI